MHLSQESVRRVMLAAQGLSTPPTTPAAKGDLLACIKQMGYLQIDTIQAVHRSQYLVLWSRLGDYDPDWLDELQEEGHLFEYYAHALCYLPIEDCPVFRGRMLSGKHASNWWKEWADAHPDIVQHVREVVEEHGPISSSDFDSPTVPDGWGDVKQEKRALSHLFSTGELMIPYRKKFRRYFDLQERVLPDWDDAQMLDDEAARDVLVLKTIKAHGLTREDWIAPYYYLQKTGISETLDRLAADGKIEQVKVEGWDVPAYFHRDHKILIDAAAKEELVPTHTTLLSPFDPLISDRERTLSLFNFDYKMESYVPAKDRICGYFCLPILHNGTLIGSLDPKAHRRQKRMEIKNIFLEPGIAIEEDLVSALNSTLADFTRWHGMKLLEIVATDPPVLLEALT